MPIMTKKEAIGQYFLPNRVQVRLLRLHRDELTDHQKADYCAACRT